MVDRTTVAIRLREARLKRHLTIKKVAEEIGVSEQSIMAYERGSRYPRSSRMIKFAKLYKTNVNDLFFKD